MPAIDCRTVHRSETAPDAQGRGVNPDAHIGASGIGIGFILVLAALFALVPQALKIIRLNSSNGLSPTTMASVAAHNTFILADTIIIKWHTIESCPHGFWHCIVRLLDCTQQALTVVTQVMLLVLFTLYKPHTEFRFRFVAMATTVFVSGLTASSIVASTLGAPSCNLVRRRMFAAHQGCAPLAGPCAPATLDVAEVYSLSASTLVLVAYVPQLIETWRIGGAKSLSYLTTFIQARGGDVTYLLHALIPAKGSEEAMALRGSRASAAHPRVTCTTPVCATLKRYPRCSNKAGATHVCPHAPRVTRSVVS